MLKRERKVEIVTVAEKKPAWVDKDWKNSSKSAKSDKIQLMIDSIQMLKI